MNFADIKKWGLARLSAAQKSHTGVATVNSSGQVCGPSGAPVSGDTVVDDFASLVALPSPADGQTAIVVAPVIGTLLTGGIPRTRWVYIGGEGWRLDGLQQLLLAVLAVSGTSITTEQTLLEVDIAAGLVPALRQMDVSAVAGRDGTTDQVTLRARIGGSSVSSQPATTGTQRSVSFMSQMAMTSETSLRAIWNGVSAAGGGGSGAVQPGSYTVPSMASMQQLSFSVQMAGTTNTGSLYYAAAVGY